MIYSSTRGGDEKLSSSEAIIKGISGNGGLFMPDSFPNIDEQTLVSMQDMSYQDRAKCILKCFLTDFTQEEIDFCVDNAYGNNFDNAAIAPVKKLDDSISVLELWHGPTSAFKDMALQILPYLMVTSLRKNGEKNDMAILVATSGDTGKAALEGFKDVEGTKVIVFYPEKGVSEVQKMQMCTQSGNNVNVIAINGNFDDAQTGVKKIFNDTQFACELDKRGISFSSANSINWGRLLPQIVYYFSAYCDMVKSGSIISGEKINVVVPTGNFGNILAGYFAKNMGLPIDKFICASNSNNVLTDFINTGRYDRKREFTRTNSPSMDILISSNLERLLYLMADRDTSVVSDWMNQLSSVGEYTLDDARLAKVQEDFVGDYATEAETLAEIKRIYEKYNYVVDTHTAVALNVCDKYISKTHDNTKTLVLSTANPFKFNSSVCEAIFGAEDIQGMSEFEMVDYLHNGCKIDVPQGLQNLDKLPIRFDRVIEIEDMKAVVSELL